MKMVELGQIPNTNIYRSLSVYRAVRGNKKQMFHFSLQCIFFP